MALEIHVIAQSDPLPTMNWRWDPDTDILSGTIDVVPPAAGYTGTVELSDDEGAMALVDVSGGLLRGIDIVVWPEIVPLPGLAAPVEARRGQVVVPARTAKQSVTSLEFDTTLSLSSDPAERTFHLRIGTRRPVEPVRVADRFVVEVDAAQRLAGFWLEDVPLRADLL